MRTHRKKLRIPGQPVHPLKQFRMEFGMSQVQLGIFLKKSRSYISLMENGTRIMTTDVILKIEKHRQDVKDIMKLNSGKNPNDTTHLELWNEQLLAKLNLRLSIILKREFNLQNLMNETDNKNMLALNAHDRLAAVLPEDAQPEHEMVFRLSRSKTTDWVKNIPAREIELKIKLELLQAEAEIIRKYMAVLAKRTQEDLSSNLLPDKHNGSLLS